MPDDYPTNLYDYRMMLHGKMAAGVKDIRVKTALHALPPVISPEERSEITDERQEITEDFLMRNAGWKPLDLPSPDDPTKTVHVEGMLVGTKEAAALLNVERPRIGKYLLLGKMPKPVGTLGAGPVWWRPQIEDMRGWVDAQRKGVRRDPRLPARS